MNKYRLSKLADEDLVRIYRYGVLRFGKSQADKYYDSLFEYFDIIADRPYSFENVDFIKLGYRKCVCGSDVIYFKINNGVIDIMRIIGQQELKNL